MATRRIEDPDLPHGGAYAIVFFQGPDGGPVEEAEATRIEAIEYDQYDKPIAITFIDVNGDETDDSDSSGTEDSAD